MELNAKIQGSGKPIIFLHGLFGLLDNWQFFANKLEKDGYMPILIDQRDHGRSPHTDTFNYEVLAQDIAAFMETNWVYNATVIGHSMGGKTAMRLALDFGHLVERLIVIDMAPKAYKSGHEDIFKAILSINLDAIESREEVFDYLMNQIGEEGTVNFLMKNLTRSKDDGGFEWKANFKLLEREYPNVLAPLLSPIVYDGPSLFLRGARSTYIKDEDIPLIKSLFPFATIKTIADAGHWVHVDNPTDLYASILSFIQTDSVG